MHLGLTPEQQALHDTLVRFLAKESSAQRVRDSEPLGFNERVWRGLVEMGVLDMAVPGAATAADLVVVAEQAGAALAPVPLVETVVAIGVLGAVPGVGIVTFAPRPAAPPGRARLVPGGAVATGLVALDGDDLVLARGAPGTAPRNLAAAPVADRELRGEGIDRVVLASGAAAHERFAAAVDMWRVLSAAALAGLARAALDLGVAYVKERRQFGVPVGSFQTVQHRLADLHTAVDGARLLAHEAAWAHDEEEANAPALASMAFAFCSELAERAAGASLHFHGGYGFMLEYDVQLYVRRAKAWRLALGDPRAELQSLADRLWGAG